MLYPQERDELARQAWRTELARFDINNVVFIDESSTFLTISRAYGWAASSERVYDEVLEVKKKRPV